MPAHSRFCLMRAAALLLAAAALLPGASAQPAPDGAHVGDEDARITRVEVQDGGLVSKWAQTDIGKWVFGFLSERDCRKYPAARHCGHTLIGEGYIGVEVSPAPYDSAVTKAGRNPTLYINGFALNNDAELVASERYIDPASKAERLRLHFHVTPKKDSKPLWTAVYDQAGLFGTLPMSVAVGWQEPVAFKTPQDINNSSWIAISTPFAVTSALLLIALFAVFFWWALCCTDTFRANSCYEWWGLAAALRKQLRKTLVQNRRFGLARFRRPPPIPQEPTEAMLQKIRLGFYGAGFDPARLDRYAQAAESARSGGVPKTQADINDTIIGLALRPRPWRPIRAGYSLARVQIGTWMMFAAMVAVFLWIVYGQFPALDGSVLGIVAISTVTSAASIFADNNTPGRDVIPSRNFLLDLSSDWSGTQQVHRFQAIVVNVLLLVVGITYVVQYLGYPTFDGSWLQFLGLSALAQTFGKTTTEEPAPTKAPPPVGPVAGS